MDKVLLVCLDGCGPEYLASADVPNIEEIGDGGLHGNGSSVIPSVTNVNNVSIITGRFPRDHGITTNYCYDRESGRFEYMESADHLLAETVLERAKSVGLSTALLTSKLKLLNLLKGGADTAFSAEEPPREYRELLGAPPAIYSMEINIWLFRAAHELISRESPDVIYLSTTDYVMHMHGPEEEASHRHLEGIDRWLGAIRALEPQREVYITADHGMNRKTKAFDPGRFLDGEGIDAEVVPIIKDRYVAHHRNLGGAAYIYLASGDGGQRDAAREALREREEVEEVHTAGEAAAKFGLLASRIGDLMILAPQDTVYGSLQGLVEDVDIRSHGSRHESAVPIIASRTEDGGYGYNLDLVGRLELRGKM